MKDYKRLTDSETAKLLKNTEGESWDSDNMNVQRYIRLAELEDKIESGELVDRNEYLDRFMAAKGISRMTDKEIEFFAKHNARVRGNADAEIARLIAQNAELRERLKKAVEMPNVFNKDIVAILYDKYKIPNLYNAKVVGIGVDTYALYEGKIDIIMTALCENGDVHFLHGRQYKKEWFLREDRAEAEARLAELKGGRE